MAEFAKEADKTRVLNRAPWTVSKHCVILSDFDPRVKPDAVRFDKLAVWARILNLPFGLMNDQRGKGFASGLGKIVKMDVDDKGRAWGVYLRVRVQIDITKPLIRCLSVFSHSRQTTEQYTVMYERLPTFCYSCGLMGHSSTCCPTPADRDEDGLLPYHGPKLCVPDERKKKQSGTNSGQSSFSSGQGCWSGTGRGGQANQAPDAPGSQNRDKDTGEVNSPSKLKKTRARKAKVVAEDGKGTGAKTEGLRISGQKRKVYRPKEQATQNVNAGAGAPLLLLPSVVPDVLTSIPDATGDGGDGAVADSNKK
jgi:hypothetical protein